MVISGRSRGGDAHTHNLLLTGIYKRIFAHVLAYACFYKSKNVCAYAKSSFCAICTLLGWNLRRVLYMRPQDFSKIFSKGIMISDIKRWYYAPLSLTSRIKPKYTLKQWSDSRFRTYDKCVNMNKNKKIYIKLLLDFFCVLAAQTKQNVLKWARSWWKSISRRRTIYRCDL